MSGKEETELIPCEVCKSPTTKQLTKNGKFYCCTSEMNGHIKQTEPQTQATSETKGKNISIGVSVWQRQLEPKNINTSHPRYHY